MTAFVVLLVVPVMVGSRTVFDPESLVTFRSVTHHSYPVLVTVALPAVRKAAMIPHPVPLIQVTFSHPPPLVSVLPPAARKTPTIPQPELYFPALRELMRLEALYQKAYCLIRVVNFENSSSQTPNQGPSRSELLYSARTSLSRWYREYERKALLRDVQSGDGCCLSHGGVHHPNRLPVHVAQIVGVDV